MKVKGYTYILICSDGSYYTGSTRDLIRRLFEHQSGIGANHTANRLPVELVYYEEFPRIDWAFDREKQIQGWSRKKKEALINNNLNTLPLLAACENISNSIFQKSREIQKLTPELEQFAKELLTQLNAKSED